MTPMQVRCPVCQAEPTKRCRSSSGMPLPAYQTHKARIKAGEEANRG